MTQPAPNLPAATFPQAIKSWAKGLVDFRGRSTRAEYWWVQLALALTIAASVLLLVAAFVVSLQGSGLAPLEGIVIVWILGIFLLSLSTIALTVRRFHDAGLSGLVYLAMVLANSGAGVVSILMGDPLVALFATLIQVGVSVGILFIALTPSVDDNKWGPRRAGAIPLDPVTDSHQAG